MAAAGTAAIASGQPRGLITAQASTASRAITETVSPTAALSVILPVPEPVSLSPPWRPPPLRSSNQGPCCDPSGLTMDRLPATLVA